MPKRTNSFQRLVALLNKVLGASARVTESAMVSDKVAQTLREVDVLIESEEAGYPVRIAIEVSSTGRKADAPWVEKMRAKHADLDTDVLILVSESGMTRAGLAKAGHYNLRVLSVEEIKNVDWPLLMRLGCAKRVQLVQLHYQCWLIVTTKSGEEVEVVAAPGAFLTSRSGTLTIHEYVDRILGNRQLREKLSDECKGLDSGDFSLLLRLENPQSIKCDSGLEGILAGLKLMIRATIRSNDIEVKSGRYKGIDFTAGVIGSEMQGVEYVLTRDAAGQEIGVLFDGERGLQLEMKVAASHTEIILNNLKSET